MTAADQSATPLRTFPPDVQTTHWIDGPSQRGCWASHRECAIAEVERLRVTHAEFSRMTQEAQEMRTERDEARKALAEALERETRYRGLYDECYRDLRRMNERAMRNAPAFTAEDLQQIRSSPAAQHGPEQGGEQE